MRIPITAATLFVASALVAAQGPEQATLPGETADAWARQALAERFAAVHQQIKPQPGESRWREIEWQASLWTAREMAAKEGKPIFLWFGSGGSPACHT